MINLIIKSMDFESITTTTYVHRIDIMTKLGFLHVFLILLLFLTLGICMAKKVYVVQMKAPVKPTPFNTNRDWFASSLHSVDSNLKQTNFLYTYDKAMQGYAVSLDPKDADALSKRDSVLGVYESREYKLLTTHTPKFLNMLDGLIGAGPAGQGSNDVIIGLLDTGIWPESKSFNDAGFSDVPPRWKGSCQKAPDFDPLLCNKKLVGAQFFVEAYKAYKGTNMTEVISPRDHIGHGTHTASTASGSLVTNASYLGLASGTAQGMAPHTRVAMYKVCWGTRCLSPDVLAGFDKAITDGVDVISASIGRTELDKSYDGDIMSVGSFSAMENGITVSTSAGNSGPEHSTLDNNNPWVINVGASSVDRDFPAFIELGNKNQFTGSTLYVGPGIDAPTEVVYNKGIKGASESNVCLSGTLDAAAIKGKVVLCDYGNMSYYYLGKEEAVRDAGGVGVILELLASEGRGALIADQHIMPALTVDSGVYKQIKEYVMSDPNPTVQMSFGKDRLNVKPAPMVASFSSRGPDRIAPQILKPDLIAPGVNILAAFQSGKSTTGTPLDEMMVDFMIMSGTSMSAPHVSGIVALLKAAHPDWGPSTIKSALMTTADTLDNTGKPILDSFTNEPASPLVMGAGHINPRAALSPGLVYQITRDQYVGFLCSLNFETTMVQRITRHPVENCLIKLADPAQLNYPSFSVMFGDNKKLLKYSREVTNVGEADSVYDVVVNAPPSVLVEVVPNKLVFNQVGQKQTYEVTFTAKGTKDKVDRTYGSVVWKNAKHTVRSPVGFSWT